MTAIAGASPRGDCPAWRRFLAEITAGDRELIAYLGRVAGYCLTGLTVEHVLFFLHGDGGNGKSVFVNVLAAILGDYAATAPLDTFLPARGERHPTDLAGLRGARLVSVVETEAGRSWAESKLKAVTGGDTITRASREYFEEEDAVGDWLAERCVADAGAFTSSTALFLDWKAWAEMSGEPVQTKNRLGRELNRRGIAADRANGCRGFRGLRLKLPAPGPESAESGR